jgi:hypothetical protein
MAYNFKNLADVELLSAMPEEANVLVEVNGKTKRAPYEKPVDEIALIVESETLEEVPEGATVLAEVNGEIKRVPGSGLGGAKAIVYTVVEDDSVVPRLAEATVTYKTVCSHTAQEVSELMLEGASCTLVIPWEALMSANVPSALGAGGTMPTFVTMPLNMYGQMNDGSNVCMFYMMMMDIMINIEHYPDETIKNSLFDQPEEN